MDRLILANRFFVLGSKGEKKGLPSSRRIKSSAKCFRRKMRSNSSSNSFPTKKFEKYSSALVPSRSRYSCVPKYSKHNKANNGGSISPAFNNLREIERYNVNFLLTASGNDTRISKHQTPSSNLIYSQEAPKNKKLMLSSKSIKIRRFSYSHLFTFALSTFVLFCSNFGANFVECTLPSAPLLTLPSSQILHTIIKNIQPSDVDERWKEPAENLVWRNDPMNSQPSLAGFPSSLSLSDSLANPLQYYPPHFIIIESKNSKINNYPIVSENADRDLFVKEHSPMYSSNEPEESGYTNNQRQFNALRTSPKFPSKSKKNSPHQSETDETQQKLLRISRNGLIGGPHHQGDNAYQIRNINDIGWFRFG